MTATITLEKRGHLLLIGLDRAPKRNAFNLQMLRELSAAYAALEADDEARVGVLFAHGDHFTAGLDLAEVGPAVRQGAALFPDDGIDPLDLYGARREKPIVVAVQGICFTIGIELMLACDVRIASATTRFAQMEPKRGIMAFGGATLRFPTMTGVGNAMRWLLTGDEFDALEAHRIGLVQEVAEAGAERDRAIFVAERIAAQAPLAVRATRRAVLAGLEGGRQAGIDVLLPTARSLMDSEDAAEGLRSFVERREAKFSGR